MRRITFSLVAVVALAGVVTSMVPHLDTPTAGSTQGVPLRETVTVAADEPIPNLSGKRLVSPIVDYPPGASSVPHRPARSTCIDAVGLSVAIGSKVDEEHVRVFRPGEALFEKPSAYHRVRAHAGDPEPALPLAELVVDAADQPLVIPDPQ